MENVYYNPGIFDVLSHEDAKKIILTPEKNKSTEERWFEETIYTMNLLKELEIQEDFNILDFGCGIGRLSKEIIDNYGCDIFGIDISSNMRALAITYVNNDKFISLPSTDSAKKLLSGKIDIAIAVWSLQHVHDLEKEILNIKDMLVPAGRLFVINERRRFVPSTVGWIDDNKDTLFLLQKHFKTKEIKMLDSKYVDSDVPARTFCGIFINN